MITGDLKSKIDGLWEDFWVGGITNPLTVIEQITFLLYSRMLDMQESKDEQRLALTGLPGGLLLFTPLLEPAAIQRRQGRMLQLVGLVVALETVEETPQGVIITVAAVLAARLTRPARLRVRRRR